MSVDPAGNFVADPGNPQSWNLYSYVPNNPRRFIDPTGLCSQDADGNYQDSDDPGQGGTFQFPFRVFKETPHLTHHHRFHQILLRARIF